jgi:hypothetical protein
MVAVDGSASSSRAFHGVLKMMDHSRDHLLVVTVRDKDLPHRFGLSSKEEVQLRFELWKSARHILKPFLTELATTLVRPSPPAPHLSWAHPTPPSFPNRSLPVTQ